MSDWRPEKGSVVVTVENRGNVLDWIERRARAAPGFRIANVFVNGIERTPPVVLKEGDLVEVPSAWMARNRHLMEDAKAGSADAFAELEIRLGPFKGRT